MSDLLFRARGANASARAPMFVVRLCGAALALAIFAMADALGVWQLVGVPRSALQLLSGVVGFLLAPTRLGSVLWVAVGALCLVTGLVVYTPITRPLAHPFLRADAEDASTPIDAVLVLSAEVTADGRLTGQALDRLLTALAEARERHVGTMALSVVEEQHGGRMVNSEADQRHLTALAAPALAVRFVYDVHSTRDEAVAFSALARAQGWHRVLVVTSPLHSRRACGAFEAVGLVVTCYAAQSRGYTLGALSGAGDRTLAFQDILYESVATSVYRARGWLR